MGIVYLVAYILYGLSYLVYFLLSSFEGNIVLAIGAIIGSYFLLRYVFYALKNKGYWPPDYVVFEDSDEQTAINEAIANLKN